MRQKAYIVNCKGSITSLTGLRQCNEKICLLGIVEIKKLVGVFWNKIIQQCASRFNHCKLTIQMVSSEKT